jgi:hypothetical protein
MKRAWFWGLTALLSAVLSGLNISAANPGVTLIGIGFISGTALDKSGLDGLSICQRENSTVCIDQATLGGLGSAVAFTGHDDVFVAVPDRGPFDGRTDVPYLDRFHFLHMTVDMTAPFPNIRTALLDTRFLKGHGGNHFVGDAYAFDADNPLATRRFDPEGAAIGNDGSFYVSDEYGPSILKFNRQGHLLARIAVPSKFLLLAPPAGNPSGDIDADGNSLELYPSFNMFGRQANRGMEGLAITPDGRTLVGIMQNALIQDHGLNAATPPGRVGVNNRILTIDTVTGDTHEYVYPVDAINQGRGVNDILAVNDHEFLVLERDNRSLVPTPPNAPQTPNLKRIYRIDLNKAGLTDVSDIASLPTTAAELAPLSIVPVTKTLFLDLLDSTYKVDATHTIKDVIAEKVEALAWGPDLPDGRHVLYVMSDNDLFPSRPTQIYAFAIDGSAAGANIAYQPQQIDGPLFPPGQVNKALQ